MGVGVGVGLDVGVIGCGCGCVWFGVRVGMVGDRMFREVAMTCAGPVN